MAVTKAKQGPTDEARATRLHADSIFINALDSTWGRDMTDEYIRNLHASGITASNVTVNSVPWSGTVEALQTIKMFWDLAKRNAAILSIVKTAEDIRRAKQEGKTSLILGFQAPKPIDDDLGLLEVFHSLGIRICGLSYQRRNYFANGCGEDDDNGLSKLGREAVRELNRLGLVIDLSHLGDRSAADVIELSAHPVIFSHSNARSMRDHFRNAPDHLIKACAAKGGVIGIGALSQFLREDGTTKGTSFEDTVNHIDYVVQLVGVEYVGIGLDAAPESRRMSDLQAMDDRYAEFGFSTTGPMEHRYAFRRIVDIIDLTRALVRRGYSDADVQKIIGANLLRVFSTVWH